MDNARIKEILLDIAETNLDFSVTQTGKESTRVNGLYKPDTHEILLHNLNFKTENELIYTAVHEYTHHLVAEETLLISPEGFIPNAKSHNQKFWAKFGALLAIAEEKGYYKLDLEVSPELKELTMKIKTEYIEKNGQMMTEFGRLLGEAYDLCKTANIRYEDYLDRVLCMPRNSAKEIQRVARVPVNPAIGFDNMKTVACIKKVDDRKEAEQELLSGKSPATVREMMKMKSAKAKSADDPKSKLEKEKSRLEKTIAQLSQRLEYVEESLANL